VTAASRVVVLRFDQAVLSAAARGLLSCDGMLRSVEWYVVCLVVCCAFASARAEDLSGAWQAETVCLGIEMPLWSSTIEHDESTGAILITSPITCLTPATCGVDAWPGGGLVSGTTVSIPTEGFRAVDFLFDEPVLVSGTLAVSRVALTGRSEAVLVDDAGSTVMLGSTQLEEITYYGLDGTPHYEGGKVDCTFESRRSSVPVGTEVSVSPRRGTHLTFTEVVKAGRALMVPAGHVPRPLPDGLQLAPSIAGPAIDFRSDAELAGPVEVCLDFADLNRDGVLDRFEPPVPLRMIELVQHDGQAYVRLPSRVDVEAARVCASVAGPTLIIPGAFGPPPIVTDHPTGGRLMLRPRGRARLRLVLADAGITPPARDGEDDPETGPHGGAVVELLAADQSAVLTLPRAGWRSRRNGRRYLYDTRLGPRGPTGVRRASLRRGKLVIVSRDPGLALDHPLGTLLVRVTIGTQRWCARFDPSSVALDPSGGFRAETNGPAGLGDCTGQPSAS
jgi:hypothetical protein